MNIGAPVKYTKIDPRDISHDWKIINIYDTPFGKRYTIRNVYSPDMVVTVAKTELENGHE